MSSAAQTELAGCSEGGANARCLVVLLVPQDFSYLPEKSILRSVVTFLTEAGKKGSCPILAFVCTCGRVSHSLPVLLWTAGPDLVHPLLVQTAVASLASVGAAFQFPPINWGLSLAPLMRLGFGKFLHSRPCPRGQ